MCASSRKRVRSRGWAMSPRFRCGLVPAIGHLVDRFGERRVPLRDLALDLHAGAREAGAGAVQEIGVAFAGFPNRWDAGFGPGLRAGLYDEMALRQILQP